MGKEIQKNRAMNNKEVVNVKWNKISQRNKRWYVLVGMPLRVSLPLMLTLIILLELFDGNRHKNLSVFVIMALAKLMVIYPIGMYTGHLEWDLLKKLVNKDFVKTRDIRKNYALIYGVWMYGATMSIAFLNPGFEDLKTTLIYLIIYPISGIGFGLVMSAMAGDIRRYIA
ncbi:MAG TPA: hypothetical protein GX707_01105 [Epulopiscium sp.]|nr:hypothetical protein [Candidatus Epulonipiscium sp.]